MILGSEPHRNGLAVSLIDPIVFLRGVDFSRERHENAPPSILRGLLMLCLTKPTRISSIEVERGDDEQIDPKTGKRKRFDVILQIPVHILSSLASTPHVALPRDTEREEAPPPPPPRAPRTSWSRRYSLPLLRHTFVPQSLITAGPYAPFVSSEEQACEVDTFERSMIFERLITGQQSEAGVEPPAYSAM